MPKGVPWFPDDVDAWSVRWVLLHLIEEIGRHAGHADIVRESIDGATMYELMAGGRGLAGDRLDAALVGPGAGVIASGCRGRATAPPQVSIDNTTADRYVDIGNIELIGGSG